MLVTHLTPLLTNVQANEWYTLTLHRGGTALSGPLSITVTQESDPGKTGTATQTVSDMDWQFRHTIQTGMVYLDDYKEISEDDSNVYVYGSKPHAVTSITSGGQTIRQYTYDLNGNMTQRIEGSDTYTFTYDTENRLMSGAKNGVTLASYTYDGDGKRVKAQEGGFTTYYIGDYYEWREGPTTTAVKYYYAAGQRIAMRKAGTLTWLLGDHLGSTTITANENSTLASEQTYTAWGQTRSGSVTTDRQYTGQISEPQLGIYFYNARFYDSYLNRFLSADSIIPGIPGRSFSPLTVDNQYISLLEQLNQENKELVRVGYLPVNSQAYDRYAYSLNNPIRYNDPDGHDPITMTLGLGFAFSIGAPEVILVVLVVGVVIVAYDTFAPGRDQRHEDIKNLWNISFQLTYFHLQLSLYFVHILLLHADVPPYNS